MTEQSLFKPDLSALVRLTHVIYGLQAFTWFFGSSFVIAVIINYVKKDDVRGTWLESHFRWQIRTFWYSLLWASIGTVLLVIFIGYAVLVADFFWIVYRVVKGWLYLNDKKEMYR